MWWIFALLSAFFAALTALFAKKGLHGVNSDLATAIRTVIILVISWSIVFFKGNFKTHFVGILGGLIWGLGNSFNLIAAGKAGPAISYGLGQGATLVAACWGVFIWKEFKHAPKSTNTLLTAMFLFFILGIGLIIYAGS